MARLDKQRDGEQVFLVSPAECCRIPKSFSNLELKKECRVDHDHRIKHGTLFQLEVRKKLERKG